MTDVVEIAKERQARIAAEIAKLDDFIRMAEALVEWSQSKAGKASDTEDEAAADKDETTNLRPYSATATAGSSAKN